MQTLDFSLSVFLSVCLSASLSLSLTHTHTHMHIHTHTHSTVSGMLAFSVHHVDKSFAVSLFPWQSSHFLIAGLGEKLSVSCVYMSPTASSHKVAKQKALDASYMTPSSKDNGRQLAPLTTDQDHAEKSTENISPRTDLGETHFESTNPGVPVFKSVVIRNNWFALLAAMHMHHYQCTCTWSRHTHTHTHTHTHVWTIYVIHTFVCICMHACACKSCTATK